MEPLQSEQALRSIRRTGSPSVRQPPPMSTCSPMTFPTPDFLDALTQTQRAEGRTPYRHQRNSLQCSGCSRTLKRSGRATGARGCAPASARGPRREGSRRASGSNSGPRLRASGERSLHARSLRAGPGASFRRRHAAAPLPHDLRGSPDLVQAEPGSLRGLDHRECPQDRRRVAAPAADSLGRLQQADFFVVADRRRGLAAQPCDRADRQRLRWHFDVELGP